MVIHTNISIVACVWQIHAKISIIKKLYMQNKFDIFEKNNVKILLYNKRYRKIFGSKKILTYVNDIQNNIDIFQ